MANNYTISPNIIPGNVTIGGSLYVQGDELRIGLTTPFVRVAKFNPSVGLFSVNVQKNLSTRDDLTLPGYAFHYHTGNGTINDRFINVAGTAQYWARRIVFLSKSVPVVVHGGSGNVQTFLTTVRAGMLGANSLLIVRVIGNVTTVAGSSGLMNLQYSNAFSPNITFPASTNTAFDVSFLACNQGATNVQVLQSLGTGTGFVFPPAATVGAFDTTIDQPMWVNITLNNAGDVANIYGIEGALLNAFGPI